MKIMRGQNSTIGCLPTRSSHRLRQRGRTSTRSSQKRSPMLTCLCIIGSDLQTRDCRQLRPSGPMSLSLKAAILRLPPSRASLALALAGAAAVLEPTCLLIVFGCRAEGIQSTRAHLPSETWEAVEDITVGGGTAAAAGVLKARRTEIKLPTDMYHESRLDGWRDRRSRHLQRSCSTREWPAKGGWWFW